MQKVEEWEEWSACIRNNPYSLLDHSRRAPFPPYGTTPPSSPFSLSLRCLYQRYTFSSSVLMLSILFSVSTSFPSSQINWYQRLRPFYDFQITLSSIFFLSLFLSSLFYFTNPYVSINIILSIWGGGGGIGDSRRVKSPMGPHDTLSSYHRWKCGCGANWDDEVADFLIDRRIINFIWRFCFTLSSR